MEHNKLSTQTASEVIQNIMNNFKYQLITKRLLEHINQFNQDYASRIGHQLTITILKNSPISQQPNKVKSKEQAWYYPQNQPKTTPIENLSNWLIKIDSSSLLQQNKTMKPQSRFRGTNSSFKYSRASNWSKKRQLPILQQKPAIPLKVSKQNQNNQRAEQKLDQQIDFIQKKLYFARQLKEKQEQQQKLRLYELRKRIPPQMPNGQFTYCFSGDFIKRKKSPKEFKHHVQEMSFTTAVNNGINQQNQEEHTQKSQQTSSNFFNTRNSIGSRYKKTLTFNNANKRQVSHLPFIKMSDNTKIVEDNRTSAGRLTQRNSLRSHANSLDDVSFKHHLQLEKQRKSVEKMKNMDQSQYFPQKIDKEKLFEEQKPLGRSRQAYIMARYLKKMGKQKYLMGHQQKSSNFELTNVTNNSSIHRYYKHDFNIEKEKIFQRQYIKK